VRLQSPRLARTATLLLVLAVLAASGAAFAISEGLKVQRAAVTAVRVDKIFSPVCRCPQARAVIGFKLTRSDRVTLGMVDSKGELVRTLVHRRLFSRGAKHFTWNGRDDDGTLVPEGSYRPRIRLQRTDRTYLLPNPIKVDMTPPRIRVHSVSPRVISPDGDGRSDILHVRYRISERAHALLYVAGRQTARTKFQRRQDNVNWYGRLDGRRLPPGTYRLGLAAVDLAGNRSRLVPAGTVRIRYVALPSRSFPVRPNRKLTIPVSTDAAHVRYTLRRGASVVVSGSSKPRLRLHAPKKPGRYVLVIEEAGHKAVAAVVVAKR
jgi:flagellar hook capping protein FlgD